MNKSYLIALMLMLALIGWGFYSPHVALKNINQAIEINDAKSLDSIVNIPNLRALATSLIDGKLELKRRVESQQDLVGAFQDYEFSRRFVAKVVDSLLTPKGFMNLVKGNLDYVDIRKLPKSDQPLFANSKIIFDSLTEAHTFIAQKQQGLQTKVILGGLSEKIYHDCAGFLFLTEPSQEAHSYST